MPISKNNPGDIDRSTDVAHLDRQIVVVDIGCRWGFAEKFTNAQDYFRVYGFDPDIEECERLSHRYREYPVSISPIGLAGTCGKRTLYVTQDPACSSLLAPDPHLAHNYPALYCTRHVSSIAVETMKLDDWAKTNNVPFIDYIKVDTQGTELEILKSSIDVLRNVRCLEVEVEFNPLYIEAPVFSDVDMFLRAQGFVLWKLTNQVHYSRAGTPDEAIGEDAIFYDEKQQIKHATYGGQLYWANAHYIKRDILYKHQESEFQRSRDIALFNALGMPDVIGHFCIPVSGSTSEIDT